MPKPELIAMSNNKIPNAPIIFVPIFKFFMLSVTFFRNRDTNVAIASRAASAMIHIHERRIRCFAFTPA
jgi:hypothetical protein